MAASLLNHISIPVPVPELGCGDPCAKKLKNKDGKIPSVVALTNTILNFGFFDSGGAVYDPASEFTNINLRFTLPDGSFVDCIKTGTDFGTVTDSDTFNEGAEAHLSFEFLKDTLDIDALRKSSCCKGNSPAMVQICYALIGETSDGKCHAIAQGVLNICIIPNMEREIARDKVCVTVVAGQDYVDIAIPSGFSATDKCNEADIQRLTGDQELDTTDFEVVGGAIRQHLSGTPEDAGSHQICQEFKKS